jgi:hypothetical protein
VAAFLPWFTDDPVAEAPLKVIITLAKHKNLIRLVSKLFKSHAEEGMTKIKWIGPDNEEDKELAKPNSLAGILVSPERNRDGILKDRLPNLKSIICCKLDTLMDLNGCVPQWSGGAQLQWMPSHSEPISSCCLHQPVQAQSSLHKYIQPQATDGMREARVVEHC